MSRWLFLAACGVGLVSAAMFWAVTGASAREYTVLWLGDSLLGDAAEPALRANGYRWSFANLPPIDDADLTIVNAEGPITSLDEEWFPDQRWSYDSREAAARAFSREGIDVASLANNHAYDRGPQGLRDTMNAVQAAGMTAIGAGTEGELATPYLVNTPHGRLAIIAFAEEGATTPSASGDQPGVRTLTTTTVSLAIQQARDAGAQWVAAFVHWGDNYTEILPSQRAWAQVFDEAGYDLVVGTGPHIVQPIEVVGDTPVAYSIGNYVFGTPGRFTTEYPGYGLALTTVLTSGGFHELRMTCVRTDNEVVLYQPRPCDDSDAQRMLAALHPAMEVAGSTGTLRW